MRSPGWRNIDPAITQLTYLPPKDRRYLQSEIAVSAGCLSWRYMDSEWLRDKHTLVQPNTIRVHWRWRSSVETRQYFRSHNSNCRPATFFCLPKGQRWRETAQTKRKMVDSPVSILMFSVYIYINPVLCRKQDWTNCNAPQNTTLISADCKLWPTSCDELQSRSICCRMV
jgi:hypothetical protein